LPDSAGPIHFSLITATLGRSAELVPLLESLSVQTHTAFDLVIVDQNTDDRVTRVIEPYRASLKINRIKNDRRGLSRNRNLGLDHIHGDVVAFPDDDCEYDVDTLKKAAAFFEENPDHTFYACNIKEKDGKRSVFNGPRGNHPITVFNCTFTACSATLFIRSASLGNFRFDEQLGVGARYGSGEETDLLYFLFKRRNRGSYFGETYIYHPYKDENSERVSYYASGFGAVYHKAVFTYGFWPLFPVFWARIAKNIINLFVKPNRRDRYLALKGRLRGFFCYRRPPKSR
jgi:glycosyltransferase involved in cell wall biosynthesis